MRATIDESPPSGVIELAQVADFDLGNLRARPSIGEVALAGGQHVTLQPRVMQVLVALAQAGGEVVSRDRLVERCWRGLAVSDDAINRCIGRLRRLAEEEGQGSFAIDTLPRIGYRLTVAGETPAGVGVLPRRRRPWRLVAAGALAIVGVAGLIWWGLAGRAAPGRGVAVAPFDTSGGDTTVQAFADGVAYEVASAMAEADLKPIRGLADDKPADVASEAIRLGAAYLLDGQVRREGATLDVTVDLSDAQSGAVLWTAHFQRAAAEGQALQEQVSVKIADVLHCALDASNYPGGRIDRETLTLFLRGCDVRHEPAKADQARDLYRQVTQREPNFGRAWSNFAIASLAATDTLPSDQAAAATDDARAAAKRALAIDPKDGLAYAVLADLPENQSRSEALTETGLAADPNDAVLANQEAGMLEATGRLDEALQFSRRAVALDPLSPAKTSQLIQYLAYDGRVPEARSVADRAVRIWPGDAEVALSQRLIEAYVGDPDRALAEFDDPKAQLPSSQDETVAIARRLLAFRKTHDPGAAAGLARDVSADLSAGKISLSFAVLILSELGANDAAYQALATPDAANELLTSVLFWPPAASLRRDPRFMPLAARLGLVARWRATGKWPDFCEAPDRPYDCRAAAAHLT